MTSKAPANIFIVDCPDERMFFVSQRQVWLCDGSYLASDEQPRE
jgi:hypothetical protein